MFVLQSTKENIKAKVLRTNMKLTEFTIFAVNTTDDFLFSRNMQLIHSIHIPRLYCNVVPLQLLVVDCYSAQGIIK